MPSLLRKERGNPQHQSAQAGRQPPCGVHESDVPGGTPELQRDRLIAALLHEHPDLGVSKIPTTWRGSLRRGDEEAKKAEDVSTPAPVCLNLCEATAAPESQSFFSLVRSGHHISRAWSLLLLSEEGPNRTKIGEFDTVS